MAFFEARISLAGEAPDTVYQRAQIKTYQTLGSLIGATIDRLRPQAGATSVASGGGQAVA